MASAITVAFILGTRRSGSTWLNAVLGSHAWAAALGEYAKVFTIPGHVTCRLCEADGRADCRVLHGVEQVAAEDAFTFAAQRFPQRVLIDASKLPEWCARFCGHEGLDARIVHLVRNPAGVIEGNSRRATGLSYAELLAEWEGANQFFETFAAESGVPHMLVSYDDLSRDPSAAFPPLCAFLGRAFEPAALRYWETPHHGLAANGAASLYLRDRVRKAYVTGDDCYYDSLREAPTRPDSRWKTRLPEAVVRSAFASPYARALAQRLGRPWDDEPEPQESSA